MPTFSIPLPSSSFLSFAIPCLQLGAVAGSFIRQKFSYLEDDMTSSLAKPLSWDEFTAVAKTGDLVFTGATHFKATIPRMYIGSRWLHTGIVYKAPDGSFWEWGVHRALEHLENSTGECSDGPQFIPLERLFALTGCIGFKRVGTTPISLDSMVHAKGMEYTDNASSIATGPIMGKIMPLISPHNGVNCSQFVALTYAQEGIIDLTQDISNYTPQSFSDLSDEVKWNVITSGTRMVHGAPTPLYIDKTAFNNQ